MDDLRKQLADLMGDEPTIESKLSEAMRAFPSGTGETLSTFLPGWIVARLRSQASTKGLTVSKLIAEIITKAIAEDLRQTWELAKSNNPSLTDKDLSRFEIHPAGWFVDGEPGAPNSEMVIILEDGSAWRCTYDAQGSLSAKVPLK